MVDYFLKAVVKRGTVNGKTVGEELEVTNGVVGVQASGLAFHLNRDYNLTTEYAIIEYTLNLKDSYYTAGIPQTCGQTYIFRVVTVSLTDVVAMPTVEKETAVAKIQTAIKNIGKATFEDYKITIYKDNLGNSVKYTYTYPYKIRMGTTTHFDIELPASLASASKVVVSFNDNGNGTQNQIEIYDKRFIYEVNL